MTEQVQRVWLCSETLSGCREPAAFKTRLGCVHEHIYWSAVCTKHAAAMRKPTATAWCHLCRTGPDSHRCPMKRVRTNGSAA